MNTGWCWMIFRTYLEENKVQIEILEHAAGYVGFECCDKSTWESKKYDRSIAEWYCESWAESGYKKEIAEQLLKESTISNFEDRYFEYIADYELICSRDYYGEYDEEERIGEDSFQEISKEEYEQKYLR